MKEVSKQFMIGFTEEETFVYIGLNIVTTDQGITLDQINYVKDRLEPVALNGGDVKRTLDKEETKLLRRSLWTSWHIWKEYSKIFLPYLERI